MTKKRNLLSQSERYAEYLLFEATGGTMGREPKKTEEVNSNVSTLDFNDKRAFLDTLIKLVSIKNKVDPEDESSGIEDFKEMLNGSGKTKRGASATSSPFNGEPGEGKIS